MAKTWKDFWREYIAEHPERETLENIELSWLAYNAGMKDMTEVIKDRMRNNAVNTF